MNPAFREIRLKFRFSNSSASLGASGNFHLSRLSTLVLREHLECCRNF